MLISVIAIFVGTWNYNALDNFVVTKLYKLKQSKGKLDSLHIKLCDGVKDFLCDKLPSCCQCCRKSRNDRGLAIGREMFEKESNIINIVQLNRYF